jgi:hypothetical protein
MTTPIKAIHIERAEGTDEDCRAGQGVHADWASAEAHIKRMARTAPEGGGYDKTDIRVEWADGESYAWRFDMTREHATDPAPLASELRSISSCWAGRRCPDHLDAAEYLKLRERFAKYTETTREARDAAFGHLLDEYEIGACTIREETRT